MASALDLLPEYLRVRITTGRYPDDCPPGDRIPHNQIRADLAMIPAAEASGWRVEFRNNHWHNSASFTRGAVHVWYTSRGWRAADLVNGLFCNHRDYPSLMAALDAETGNREATP